MTSKHVAPRGTGPTIAAVERREASVSAETQGARWRLRACVTGPPKGAAAPGACRRSAPSPGVTGKPCLGGYLPRENDHAYADIG